MLAPPRCVRVLGQVLHELFLLRGKVQRQLLSGIDIAKKVLQQGAVCKM